MVVNLVYLLVIDLTLRLVNSTICLVTFLKTVQVYLQENIHEKTRQEKKKKEREAERVQKKTTVIKN